MSQIRATGNTVADPVRELRVRERAVLVATLLIAECLPRIIPDSDAFGGSLISQCVWSSLYLIAFAGIIAERKTATRLVRASLPIVLILLAAILSTFWSEAPLVTAKESIALVGSSCLGLFFVCRLSLRAVLETLTIGLAIAAVASAVLIAFAPSLGRMQEDPHLWQGAFVHKNWLGGAMALGITTLACIVPQLRGIRRALHIALGLLFVILLLGSGSMTNVIVAVMLALILPLLLGTRAAASLKPVIIAAMIVAVGVFGAINFGATSDQAFSAIGKDATLTGRTDLWQFALDAVAEQPILGYGFDVFFNPSTTTGQDSVRSFDWDVNMAHNGFLEVTLGLGLVGLLPAFAAIFVGIRRALVFFKQHRDLVTAWPLLVMLYTLFTNMTEASIARVNNFDWILFLVAFFFSVDAYQRGVSVAKTYRPAFLPRKLPSMRERRA